MPAATVIVPVKVLPVLLSARIPTPVFRMDAAAPLFTNAPEMVASVAGAFAAFTVKVRVTGVAVLFRSIPVRNCNCVFAVVSFKTNARGLKLALPHVIWLPKLMIAGNPNGMTPPLVVNVPVVVLALNPLVPLGI